MHQGANQFNQIETMQTVEGVQAGTT